MNVAILLSGGTGTRLGSSIPKQYIEVDSKMIIEYSLSRLLHSSKIDGIVIVCAPEWKNNLIKFESYLKPVIFADAGVTRQTSVFNGLLKAEKFFKDSINIVLVHDAARPLVSDKLINDCIDACGRGFDGAMPVLPLKDTIYYSEDNQSITKLLDRSKLYAGQAPEAFDFKKYLDAHLKIDKEKLLKINGSSELAFLNGMSIKLIKGDLNNFKITDSEDLNRFKQLCDERECLI